MSIQPNDEITRIKNVYGDYKSDRASRYWSEKSPEHRVNQQERYQRIESVLDRAEMLPLDGISILDIGCGSGKYMARLHSLGAEHKRLYGIDLLRDRIESARHIHPEFHYLNGDAAHLPFKDHSFDLVMVYVVFTSILDEALRRRIADEIDRILLPGGALLWYDFRYNNPQNKNVRGIKKAELHSLFEGYSGSIETMTLLPPLARLFGPVLPMVYPLLRSIPFLRSHYLALLRKP